MTKFYTGIGSRKCPIDIMRVITQVGIHFAQKGYTLRSGGAAGADSAFATGAMVVNIHQEIYIPWKGFIDDRMRPIAPDQLDPKLVKQAQKIASEVHPAWNKCNDAAKKLHSRNVFQVLGKDLNTPSSFLICWTERDDKGLITGGTRTAWELAKKYNIPCFNLYDEETLIRINKMLEGSK